MKNILFEYLAFRFGFNLLIILDFLLDQRHVEPGPLTRVTVDEVVKIEKRSRRDGEDVSTFSLESRIRFLTSHIREKIRGKWTFSDTFRLSTANERLLSFEAAPKRASFIPRTRAEDNFSSLLVALAKGS